MLIASKDLFLLSIRPYYFKLDETVRCDFVSLLQQVYGISGNTGIFYSGKNFTPNFVIFLVVLVPL